MKVGVVGGEWGEEGGGAGHGEGEGQGEGAEGRGGQGGAAWVARRARGGSLDEELVILDHADVELGLVGRDAALLLRGPRHGCMHACAHSRAGSSGAWNSCEHSLGTRQNRASLAGLPSRLPMHVTARRPPYYRPQGEGGRTTRTGSGPPPSRPLTAAHPAGARGTFATRHRSEQHRQSSLPLHPMRGSLTHAAHRHAGRVGMWTGCDSPGACGWAGPGLLLVCGAG